MEIKLSEILSEGRYNHCIRTKEMAERLCEIHNIDKRAVMAAYYHDCAKELTLDEMRELVGDSYKEDIDGMYNRNILHGYAGAVYAKQHFGIDDPDMLSAIRYHTTGKKYMSDIEKVVYISDAIELGRDYEHVDEIREACYQDLDKGILLELNYKIIYLIERKLEIHKNSIEFRNQLLKEVKDEK